MKTVLSILSVLILGLCSQSAYCQTSKQIEIDREVSGGINPIPRSVSPQAKAWFSVPNTLSVQLLYTCGSAEIALINSTGEIVYQSSTPADGSKQPLFLPALESDLYTLTISCDGCKWSGELTI